MMNGDICPALEEPCAARCPNDLACPQHTVWVKSEHKSQCKGGYDEKSAGCSRRFQFSLNSFAVVLLAVVRCYGCEVFFKSMGL